MIITPCVRHGGTWSFYYQGCPTRRGQFNCLGKGHGKAVDTSSGMDGTYSSRSRAGHLDSLLSLFLQSWLCLGKSIAHVQCRRSAWASRGSPRLEALRALSQAGGLGRTAMPHSCTTGYSRGDRTRPRAIKQIWGPPSPALWEWDVPRPLGGAPLHPPRGMSRGARLAMQIKQSNPPVTARGPMWLAHACQPGQPPRRLAKGRN